MGVNSMPVSSTTHYRTAVLQVADTGPLESLVDMLQAVGFNCFLPNKRLRNRLREIGCDTVLAAEDLVKGMGYEPPEWRGQPIPEVDLDFMDKADLYVDIKAHRCYSLVTKEWPNLKNKVLWYRINGGEPEHVINDRGDHGDEVNPPCPVLTPNQWYSYQQRCSYCHWWFPRGMMVFTGSCLKCGSKEKETMKWKAYCCWPPFVKFHEYDVKRPGFDGHIKYSNPICLIHNVNGWGYRDMVAPVRDLGVNIYGVGSPDGLINHKLVKVRLTSSLAMVHLKSNDAPGYALYEAMAAGCPIILPRRLIWRCSMESMFRPGVNCLVFDRETHDPLSGEEVRICTREIRDALTQLSDPVENQRIGYAGRETLKRLMWDRAKAEDVTSLKDFMTQYFPYR